VAAIWLRLRAEVRSRWRAWLAVGLIIGLAGGAVMAAAAGARRTDTAYARFLRATDAPDVSMPIFPWLPIARYDVNRVAAIPQVARLDRITNFFVEDGPTVGASADPAILRRLRVVQGRLPRADRVDELVVGFSAVERLRGHVKVGSFLPIRFSGDQEFGVKPLLLTFKVVGITASAADFPPVEEGSPTWSSAYASPAFHAAYAGKLSYFDLLAVRLRRGDNDLPGFEKALARSVGRRGYFIFRERDHAANVQRTNHLQAVALWLLAGLIAAAAALVLAQTLVRQTFLESADHGVLRALGVSRIQLWGLAMTRAALIGTMGAVVAVGVAWLLSPLTPMGLARTAEPHPGFSVNASIFGLGAAATLVLIILLAAWPAWRASRSAAAGVATAEASGQERPSAIANAFARSGLPTTTVAGARLAFERGRGNTAVPVRSTIAAVTIGIAALATAFGFAASLTHLTNTPRLYGFTWDANFFVEAGASSLGDRLRSDPRIQAFSVGSGGYPLLVGGVPVQAMVLEGTVMPPILEGRGLRGGADAHEILLGSQTLRSLGAHVGDMIPVGIQGQSGRSFAMRIVVASSFRRLVRTPGSGEGPWLGSKAHAC
jgi:putative ABC transport system permease protein